MNDNLFGSYLRSRRRELGLTLAQVARKLRFSIVYVGDVEKGKRRPFKPDTFPLLCEILETDAPTLERLRACDERMIEISLDSKAGAAALALLERKDDLPPEKAAMILKLLES